MATEQNPPGPDATCPEAGAAADDSFADLLVVDPEVDAAEPGAPVARHGHFGDGLFGEAKPTGPRSLATTLLSGTIGSLVAVGAGLGLVLGVGVSLVGRGGEAPARSGDGSAAVAAADPGADAGAAAGQQGSQQGGTKQGSQQGGTKQGSQQGGQAGSTRPAAQPSAAVDAQGRPTMTGSFTLWAADPQKNACADHPSVPDIAAGAAVVLTDGNGKELARTKLSTGRVEATKRGCTFPFTFAGLPQASTYQLKVGRQSALAFAASDLAKNGWRVQLNLGLPSQTSG